MQRTLDHITNAVGRVRQYGESEAGNYWARNMDSDDRLAFDLFLVKMNDELAYQAGPPEHRFTTRVIRMASVPGGLTKPSGTARI